MDLCDIVVMSTFVVSPAECLKHIPCNAFGSSWHQTDVWAKVAELHSNPITKQLLSMNKKFKYRTKHEMCLIFTQKLIDQILSGNFSNMDCKIIKFCAQLHHDRLIRGK
jgi:hypothetical protein